MESPVHRTVSTWQQPLPPPASRPGGPWSDLLTARVPALSPGRLRVGVDGPRLLAADPAPTSPGRGGEDDTGPRR